LSQSVNSKSLSALKIFHKTRFDKNYKPIPVASPPRAGFSGMGSNYIIMSNYRNKSRKTTASVMDKYKDLDMNVNEVLRAQRGNTLEMKRHENTLSLQHIEHGKALARMETRLVEKQDRATLATNF